MGAGMRLSDLFMFFFIVDVVVYLFSETLIEETENSFDMFY